MLKIIKDPSKYVLLTNDSSLFEKTFRMSEVIQIIHKIRNTKVTNKEKNI